MDAPAPRRSRIVVWLAGVLAVLVGFAALYTWATLSFSYAKGERVGYIQKFSKRGWICKTWEGELAMTNLPGTIPEKFYFSTRSNPIATQVNSMLGKRVRVRYAQHKFVPSTCFGETEYFIADAQPVE
ncbi:MAG TPA: hypothetical protein VG496_02855 [Myxococcales bacterium]|nr:hypothetical protein [Myxococcales bacterium]